MTRTRPTDDEGFTLIEVVVAVVLMALVMASVSVFFVQGIATGTGLQRRNAAVQVADQAMQLVRGVPTTESATGVSPLVRNRRQADVQAQWLDAPAELAGTSPSWDPSPALAPGGTPAPPVLPLEDRATVGSQEFDVDTFVGSCTQPASAAPCSSAAGVVGQQAYRVVVRVRWDEDTCAAGTCEYLATTLVNSKGDLIFNTGIDAPRPVANPDNATTGYSTDVTVNVLTNDSGGLSPSPVSMSGQPPLNGTFVGNTSTGLITYRPNPGFVGTDSFRYRITDVSGLTSDPAIVTVTVTNPAITAQNDAVTMTTATTRDVDVRANDTGYFATPPAVTLRSPVPSGAVLGPSGTIRYVAPATTGTRTILYTITDVVGQSRDAQLVVTVVSPPQARADSATTVGTTPVTSNVRTNDDTPLNSGTVSAPTVLATSGTAVVNASNQVVFTPRAGFTGDAVITYTVTGGGFTASGTLTVAVTAPAGPTATATTTQCVQRQGSGNTSVDVSVALAGLVTGTKSGGTYAVVGLPSSYTGSLNATTGVWTLRSAGRPADSANLTWRFTDAWGQSTGSRTLRLEGKSSC